MNADFCRSYGLAWSPKGTTFGFNGRAETGETWIHVFGPAAASTAKSPAGC